MIETPTSVLTVCLGNICRSPMAEGILKWLHGERIYVDSVGVRAGELNGFMVEVMTEVDINLSGHQPKTFQILNDTSFDLVVSLSPEAQHSAVELTRWMACDVEYWPTINPDIFSGTRDQLIEQYRALRDDLIEKISNRFGSDDERKGEKA